MSVPIKAVLNWASQPVASILRVRDSEGNILWENDGTHRQPPYRGIFSGKVTKNEQVETAKSL